MKILIVSDSHGLTSELMTLKEKHQQEVDFFIHCGDSELAADSDMMKDFIAVRGNCDFDENYPNDYTKKIEDCQIFVTHGHLYSVKTSLMSLLYRSKQEEADVVCFGHSHLLGAEMIQDTFFINPGSIRLPRGRREKTYVILEISADSFVVDVYDVNKGKIPQLTQRFTRST